jgi:UPF0755 protein
MKYKLTILVALLLFILVPSYLYYLQAIKPVNPMDNTGVNFYIQSGESVRQISQRLYDTKLVRSSLIFFLKARLTELGKNIQAGDFILSPSMDMNEISGELLHGTTDVRLTIPEGWRKEEITLKIAAEFNIPESEILKTAREGYLFPDTYFIPKEATGEKIVKIMEDNFAKKTANLNKSKLNKHNITFDDTIIIASLIEREARLPEDRPVIASVILNRLKIGMKLDIDATIQYILGYQPETKTWWKKNLTADDLQIDSPYNTYTNPGLPPTAIANPGLASIEAVLTAPETDYLYYIGDKTGKSHFAATFEEHAANIEKYLHSSTPGVESY